MNITIRQSEMQKKLVRAASICAAISFIIYIGLYLSLVIGGISFKKIVAETKSTNSKVVKLETEISTLERNLHDNNTLAYLKPIDDTSFIVRKDSAVTFSFLYEVR
jgi:hypothetical protein